MDWNLCDAVGVVITLEGRVPSTVDDPKIQVDAIYDGQWVLRTNMDLETELAAQSYKHLWTVENLFRTMKSALATRLIYHKRDETILGQVFCSFLALRLRRELETRLEQTGSDSPTRATPHSAYTSSCHRHGWIKVNEKPTAHFLFDRHRRSQRKPEPGRPKS